jgi:hypothetical protein
LANQLYEDQQRVNTPRSVFLSTRLSPNQEKAMNKPVKQLELIPNGELATGLSPEVKATIDAIIADEGTVLGDDFDWQANDDAIVVKPQPGIAVYLNKADDVVIRTQNTTYPGEDDHFAFIQPESLQAVIDRLCDIAGIGSGGKRS